MKNKKSKQKIILFTPVELRQKHKDLECVKDNSKILKFKEQLTKAHDFRAKHFKNGIEIYKVGYLYELEQEKPFEGITRSYDLGYMTGYKAAQRQANKKRKETKHN